MSTRTPPNQRKPKATGNRAVADARRSGGGPSGNQRTIVIAAIAAVVVLAALAIALLAGGGDDDSGETEADTAAREAVAATPVEVDGDPLAAVEDVEVDDPAVGTAFPTLTGTDLAGDALTIGGTGRPAMVVFLAHWCPHCQAEVPVIVDWVADGGLPEGVDLVGVATANDERRGNYPASAWLDEEGWDAPTLLDDPDETAALAGGVSSFPFMVFVDADGTVVSRAAGELTTDQLDEHVSGITER